MEDDNWKNKANLKEIKDMVECLLEKSNEVELLIQRHDVTICNLEGQVRQLVEAFSAQQANIVDSSQEEHEWEEELDVLMQD